MTESIWPKHLVSTNWLLNHINDPGIKILDGSTTLVPKPDYSLYTVVPAIDNFKKGHIPNAQFIDIDHELSTPNELCHFMLPSGEKFSSKMGELGIDERTMVVVYSTTDHWWATRLWWTFKVFGHENIVVLDGGYQKWSSEGLPTVVGESTQVSSAKYPVKKLDKSMIADKEAILNHLHKSTPCLINALRPEQHNGTGGVNYGRKGHIIKSINLPALAHVNEDNSFKSYEELMDIFKDSLAQEEIILIVEEE